MRFVKTVVADVCKADVVGEVGIEHIVADAATDAQTTIQTAEVVAAEGTLGLSLGKVLDLATYTQWIFTQSLAKRTATCWTSSTSTLETRNR